MGAKGIGKSVVNVDDRTRTKRKQQIVDMKEDGVIVEGQPRTIDVNDSTRIKLANLGITPDQSSNYQAMAAIPEPVCQRLPVRLCRMSCEVTTFLIRSSIPLWKRSA